MKLYQISLLLAALAGFAPAYAVSITEPPDLPNSGGLQALDIGVLDTGINTVSGSLNGVCVATNSELGFADCNRSGSGDTQDSFVFSVAPGQQLVRASVLVSNLTPEVRLSAFGSSLGIFAFNLENGDSGNLLVDVMGGRHEFSVLGGVTRIARAYSADYEVTLEVSAVPLPAALWLFLSALGGLAGFKKWRR